MKRLHKAIISFGIVAALMAGSSSVFAKSETSKARAISGTVIRIDRGRRTITVREHGTDRDIQIVVPAGRALRTSQVTLPVTNFEQLLVGMFVRDVNVQ